MLGARLLLGLKALVSGSEASAGPTHLRSWRVAGPQSAWRGWSAATASAAHIRPPPEPRPPGPKARQPSPPSRLPRLAPRARGEKEGDGRGSEARSLRPSRAGQVSRRRSPAPALEPQARGGAGEPSPRALPRPGDPRPAPSSTAAASRRALRGRPSWPQQQHPSLDVNVWSSAAKLDADARVHRLLPLRRWPGSRSARGAWMLQPGHSRAASEGADACPGREGRSSASPRPPRAGEEPARQAAPGAGGKPPPALRVADWEPLGRRCPRAHRGL